MLRTGSRLASLALLLGVSVGLVRPAVAQEGVRVSGLAYLDYFVQLATPDSAREGLHGFNFRRLYLTADATLSDAFSARARLEASDVTLGPRGSTPFVKDLYLRWRHDSGHGLTLGITSPPVWDVSERVWDFRSLERTLLELNRVASSRDLGLRADGPIPVGREGLLRYAVMVGNNEGVFPEDDVSKRVYAQLEVRPAEPLVFTLGGSLAGYDEDRDDERTGAWDANAFLGYVSDAFRGGVEAFYQQTDYADDHALDMAGASVFGTFWVTPEVGVVGRFDRVRRETFQEVDDGEELPVAGFENFATGGVAYRAHEGERGTRVRLIPNVRWAKADDGDSDLQARFTAEVSF